MGEFYEILLFFNPNSSNLMDLIEGLRMASLIGATQEEQGTKLKRCWYNA